MIHYISFTLYDLFVNKVIFGKSSFGCNVTIEEAHLPQTVHNPN